ncbi:MULTISPECIES: LTA synthase family protein [Paenibacillus]|uniref:LTA synthase family protein n=1 Tax=Paenibacillus TaxID=44249 RepID=UPI002FE20E99
MPRAFKLFRHLGYILFILVILLKLRILHDNLHALYIDMNALDHLIAAGSIMLASFWTLWLPGRGRTIALGILNVLLTVVIFADLVYYRYFADFITVPVLFQAGQVGELGESIRSLLRPTDLWLFADWMVWLVSVLVERGYRRRKGAHGHAATRSVKEARHSLHSLHSLHSRHSAAGHDNRANRGTRALSRLIAGLAVFALGFVLTMAPIRHYTKTWAAGLFEGGWWNISLYNVTGLLGFHGYDVYRYAKEHIGGETKMTEQEKQELENWFAQKADARNEANASFGAYRGSNVLVVQVEAFMNFMIGREIGGQEITPNFNKLMKESLYYSNYYHQTGQGRTSDADFSSQSSLHPLPTGSVFVRYPDHSYDVLPQILGSRGYETAVFHAYEGGFWNRNNMYKAMEYDHFYSKKDFTLDEPLGWSLGDKSFFRQSLDLMSKEKQPFYSFLITLSSHHPYSLPAAVKELDTGEFKDSMFGNYLESVHYADAALGELMEGMKEKGLWDNTILYVYGDHDNSITEKEDYEKFLGKPLTELDMHQIMNQVPLLVHLPGGKTTGVDDRPSGQLDMAPSLLHVLGIPSDGYYMMGNNLFASSPPFVVLRSGAFTDGKLYYIPSPDNLFENGACYDLATGTKTDIEPCRVPYDRAKKQLQISDRLITEDLIPQLRNAMVQEKQL